MREEESPSSTKGEASANAKRDALRNRPALRDEAARQILAPIPPVPPAPSKEQASPPAKQPQKAGAQPLAALALFPDAAAADEKPEAHVPVGGTGRETKPKRQPIEGSQRGVPTVTGKGVGGPLPRFPGEPDEPIKLALGVSSDDNDVDPPRRTTAKPSREALALDETPPLGSSPATIAAQKRRTARTIAILGVLVGLGALLAVLLNR